VLDLFIFSSKNMKVSTFKIITMYNILI
jgi:hypothetical protein